MRLLANKRAGSSFRGKSLLRSALLCLRTCGTSIDWTSAPETTPNIPHPQSEHPKVDDVTEWCLALLGDREATVRGLACGVLSCIAAHPRTSSETSPVLPSSPHTSWQSVEVLKSVLGVGCDESECYEVKAEALGFVANLVANFLTYAQHADMDILDAVVFKADSQQNNDNNNVEEHASKNNNNNNDSNSEKANSRFSQDAILHKRILSVLQQVNFFPLLAKFLTDSHAAPVFLHSLMHLLWLLLCMDNGEVPQRLMQEGIWPLLVDLLNLDNYWVKYCQCWTSFWKGM